MARRTTTTTADPTPDAPEEEKDNNAVSLVGEADDRDENIETVTDPQSGEQVKALSMENAVDPDKLRAALVSVSGTDENDEPAMSIINSDVERMEETARSARLFRQTLDLRDPAHGTPVTFLGS
jgi:hypothetical protein